MQSGQEYVIWEPGWPSFLRLALPVPSFLFPVVALFVLFSAPAFVSPLVSNSSVSLVSMLSGLLQSFLLAKRTWGLLAKF